MMLRLPRTGLANKKNTSTTLYRYVNTYRLFFISFAAPAIDNLSMEEVISMFLSSLRYDENNRYFEHTVLTSFSFHSHIRACSPMAADWKNLADSAVMNSTIRIYERARPRLRMERTWCCACIEPNWPIKRTHPQHYTNMSIHTVYFSSASRLRP